MKIPSREGKEGFSLQGWVLPVPEQPTPAPLPWRGIIFILDGAAWRHGPTPVNAATGRSGNIEGAVTSCYFMKNPRDAVGNVITHRPELITYRPAGTPGDAAAR